MNQYHHLQPLERKYIRDWQGVNGVGVQSLLDKKEMQEILAIEEPRVRPKLPAEERKMPATDFGPPQPKLLSRLFRWWRRRRGVPAPG